MTAPDNWRQRAVPVFWGIPDSHLKTGDDYGTMTLGQIFGMAPGKWPKMRGLAMLAGNYCGHDARRHAVQRERGSFVALAGDIDKGDHTFASIAQFVRAFAGNAASLIYSTPTTLATGSTRDVFDPTTAAGIDALVRAGRPVSEAQAFAKAQGYDQFDAQAYATNAAWARQHPSYQGSFTNAHRTAPTTTWQQISASAPAAAVSGVSNALTAGYNDEAAAAIKSALTGADYTQTRDDLNARKSILATTHPLADLAGNVVGGAGAMALGGAAAARFAPGAVRGAIGMFGRGAPIAGDAAYGALYGSGQDNDSRLGGALTGGLAAAGGGMLARGVTRSVGNVIAPPAGSMAPAYDAGVFPTIGQRFARSGVVGKAINTTEQALQSFPALGGLISHARQNVRNGFQRGGFNSALGDIGTSLPADVGAGTDAHALASQAFGTAYDGARQGMQFVPDHQYMGDLGGFIQRLNGGVLNDQQAQQVGKVIQNSVGSRLQSGGGSLDGNAYQNAGSELGAAANTWGRDGMTQPMASAIRDYMSIFDDAARRNSAPDAVRQLDSADSGYAKLVRLQNASARGGVGKGAGTFTPNDLLGAVKQEAGGVRSSAYNRGAALMQDYADAGRNLSDTLPNSGSAERLLTGQAVAGGLGAALHAPAAVVANPLSLAPFAMYAPGLDQVMRRMIAPRQYVLPPNLAAPINAIGSQIYNRAPAIGKVAAPALMNWALDR